MKLGRLIGFAALCALPLTLTACGGEDESSAETGDEQNITAKTGGEFELYESQNDGQFYLRLKAANGENILRTQGYASKESADNAIDSIIENGSDFDNYRLIPSSSNPDGKSAGEHYFNLVSAANGQTLGTGEIYGTKSNAKRGAQTVMGYILGNPAIDDWTNVCGHEMFQGQDDQFYFRLNAGNGEQMLRSEAYSSEDGAKGGIDSVISFGADVANFEVLQANNGEFYFNIMASNGQIVATSSETYTTQQGAEGGVDTVVGLIGAQVDCKASN